jgi:hypothetical protein
VRQSVTYLLAALKRVVANCSAACVKSEVLSAGSVNVTAFGDGDVAPWNVFNEGSDECCSFLRNVDSYLRQINRHSTSCVLSRRTGRRKCKMLQTAGLGLTHRPCECESELSEQCVQTARYRA